MSQFPRSRLRGLQNCRPAYPIKYNTILRNFKGKTPFFTQNFRKIFGFSKFVVRIWTVSTYNKYLKSNFWDDAKLYANCLFYLCEHCLAGETPANQARQCAIGGKPGNSRSRLACRFAEAASKNYFRSRKPQPRWIAAVPAAYSLSRKERKGRIVFQTLRTLREDSSADFSPRSRKIFGFVAVFQRDRPGGRNAREPNSTEVVLYTDSVRLRRTA